MRKAITIAIKIVGFVFGVLLTAYIGIGVLDYIYGPSPILTD